MSDYTFNRILEQRAENVVHAAAPEERALSMGYGQTLKQARANAVGFIEALNAEQPMAYSFADPNR